MNTTKTNKRIRILKTQELCLDIYMYYQVASLNIFFIQLHVVCLIFEVLFTLIPDFFQHLRQPVERQQKPTTQRKYSMVDSRSSLGLSYCTVAVCSMFDHKVIFNKEHHLLF